MTHDPFLDPPRPGPGCTRLLAVGATGIVVGLALATWGAATIVGLAAVLALPTALAAGLIDHARRNRTTHHEFAGVDERHQVARALDGDR